MQGTVLDPEGAQPAHAPPPPFRALKTINDHIWAEICSRMGHLIRCLMKKISGSMHGPSKTYQRPAMMRMVRMVHGAFSVWGLLALKNKHVY